MFVLLSLMTMCLRSVFAPFGGTNQPAAPVPPAQPAIIFVAGSQTQSLVPIHAPTLRHLV